MIRNMNHLFKKVMPKIWELYRVRKCFGNEGKYRIYKAYVGISLFGHFVTILFIKVQRLANKVA